MNFKKITQLMLSIVMMLFVSINAYSITLSLPNDGDDCVAENPMLSWVQAENIQEYIVELSETNDFAELFYTQTGITTTSHTANITEYGKMLYWRVIAVNLSNERDTSVIRSFTTRFQAPMGITSDNLACSNLSLKLEWMDVAETYIVQVATDNAFANLVYNANNVDTNFVNITVTEYDTTYFWRVAAYFDECATGWMEFRSFSTRNAPLELVAPENNAKGIALFDGQNQNIVEASWDAVDNASYTFQASTDAEFSVEDILIEEVLDTNVYNLAIPALNNTKVYWRVAYNLGECLSAWSEVFNFITEYEAIVNIMPMDQDTCIDYEMTSFCWNPFVDSTNYRLQISSHESFADTLLLLDSAMIIDTCFNYSLGFSNTVFYWRVRAEDDLNLGAWSPIFMNQTVIGSPELISPVGNIGGVELISTITWEEIGDTNYRYHLQVSKSADNFAINVLDTMYLKNSNYDIILQEKFTQYFWRVRTMNPDSCWSPWSEVESFKTNIAQPILIEPANEATNVPLGIIWYEWNTVPGAATYILQVASDENFENILDEETKLIETRNILLDFTYSENTKYYWRVRAVNPDGQSDWSETFEFTTWILKPNTPILISPEANSTSTPLDVELQWSEDERAAFFKIEVYDDLYLENKIIDTTSETNSLQLNDLDIYKKYYWRVKAVNAAGESNWSINFNFRTINIVPTEKASILLPDNNSDEQELTLKFDWTNIEHAIYYWLQIATQDNFSQLEFEYKQIPESQKIIYGLDYGTNYFWRVKGWNEEGEGPWSEVFSFRTKVDLSVNEEFTKSIGLNLYPNPANDNATISFNAINAGTAEIRLYDALGQELSMIFSGYINQGHFEVSLNTDNLSSGVYYYTINLNGNTAGGVFAVSK